LLIFDIETDGLLDELTKVHTLHILDKATGVRTRYNEGFFADGSPAPRDGSIADGLQLLAQADEVCGHNIINFDIPAITKVYPWFKLKLTCVVHDTVIYAPMIWPDIKERDAKAIKSGNRPFDFAKQKLVGKHSLKAWGMRLGVLKGDYDGEWTHFTQEMEEYAAQDPVTTEALWDKCVEKRFGDNSEESIRLEHDVAFIIGLQERYGFAFDTANAELLQIELIKKKAELEDQLRETFRPWYAPERKHGKHVIMDPKRPNKTLGYTPGCVFTKIKLVSFNPGSRQQIANRLIELYDWIPVEFTDSGAPKVDETTLDSLDHIPAARLLVEYLTVDKRLGQLAEGDNAWLKKVRADGRIHGRVSTLGAITRRMTHWDPNMAQVPSIVNAKGTVPFGRECRALFMASTGMTLCGCDAEGLELRMLAHYMAKTDGGSYGDTVVNGDKDLGTDVHTVNKKLIRLNSRSSAKTWIYAYLYGAGVLKLGMVIYEDFTPEQREAFNAQHKAGKAREDAVKRLGIQARRRVEQGLPALGALQEKIKRLAAKGFLPTLDGGRLKVRSAHSALNTLLQGGGAIVMKKALVILFRNLVEAGWVPNIVTGALHRGDDVMGFVVNVHDEYQMEAPHHLADEIGQLGKDAIRLAGEAFALRCPLAGSFDKGRNWAETH
jgi:DNA polymerase I-like protein with 3'-5' exonuclease and polymerase domains